VNRATAKNAKNTSERVTIGECYVFFRDGHGWNGCEVAVLSQGRRGFRVARAIHVCIGLLAPKGSKKRKLKTWVCKGEELW
jgi:hypothetical protein